MKTRTVAPSTLRNALLALLLALSLAALPACSASNGETQNSAPETGQTSEPASDSAEEVSHLTVTVDADGTGENVKTYVVTVDASKSNALDALLATDADVSVADSEYGAYVESIDGVANGDKGSASGWVYTVNGQEVMVSADECDVESGSSIEWTFVS